METLFIAGVLGVILLAFIAIGGAVYHTIRNKKAARLRVEAEYANAFQPEPVQGSWFFQNEHQAAKTVRFYASAPSLGVEIPSDRAIACDYDEICRFVDRIYDNTEDNFFTLEDDREYCIQFFHAGNDTTIEIDIPDPAQKGSYKGEFSNIRDVKTCIKSFFNQVSVHFDYPLTFERW